MSPYPPVEDWTESGEDSGEWRESMRGKKRYTPM